MTSERPSWARQGRCVVVVKIVVNTSGNPPGKLADAELQFEEGDGVPGLRLIGFAVWERHGGSGRNVTFPARQYNVNGERRSFLRAAILEAYAEAEAAQGQAQAAQDETTKAQAQVTRASRRAGPGRAQERRTRERPVRG